MSPDTGFWFFGRPSVYDLWSDLRELRREHDYNFDPLAPGVREEWERRHPERMAARTRKAKASAPKRRAAKRSVAAGRSTR